MKDHKKEFEINAVSLSDDILENVSGGNGSRQEIWISEGEMYYSCEGCDLVYFTDEPCPVCGTELHARCIAKRGFYAWGWQT